MPRPLLFVLFVCAPALVSAQRFTVGLKGGVRATGDLTSYFAKPESKRYVVGPMASAGLPLGFRVEVDALYRHVAYRASNGSFAGFFTERDSGYSWEFPLILRRAVWRGIYAGAGYVPRVLNGTARYNSYALVSVTPMQLEYVEYSSPAYWETTHGVLAVAGVERKVGPVRIAPEVRYTYWNHPALERYGTRGFFIGAPQNQVDVLLGVSFP